MTLQENKSAAAVELREIGPYRLGELLGEGGMGCVYEAEEILTGRIVALKLMRHELAQSSEARRLFLREMELLSCLQHPRIVRSLSCLEHEGQLAMAMERLQGCSLRVILAQRGALAWWRACHIVLQIAQGLQAAHEHDPPIVHRDLKPENIMIERDGSVKVMDFGIAKALLEHSPTQTRSAGTLQYMSPEQIDAVAIDARSDLYALGLVMFELLTGKAPFQSASPRRLLEMQCTQAPPPLSADLRSQLPVALTELLSSLLSKKPAGRPASAAEVVEILTPLLPDADTERPPVSGDRVVFGEAMDTLESTLVTEVFDGESQDTMVLIEGGQAPPSWSLGRALAVVAMACLLSGVVTYVVKVQAGGLITEIPAATP